MARKTKRKTAKKSYDIRLPGAVEVGRKKKELSEAEIEILKKMYERQKAPISVIALTLGVSPKTVQRYVKKLIEAGELQARVETKRTKGKKTTQKPTKGAAAVAERAAGTETTTTTQTEAPAEVKQEPAVGKKKKGVPASERHIKKLADAVEAAKAALDNKARPVRVKSWNFGKWRITHYRIRKGLSAQVWEAGEA
ncbi:MAG: winged helix-turn-helix transcriptional regulator [Pyrobaculum sp.]